MAASRKAEPGNGVLSLFFVTQSFVGEERLRDELKERLQRRLHSQPPLHNCLSLVSEELWVALLGPIGEINDINGAW